MAFAARLASARHGCSLTQAALAKQARVTVHALRVWEGARHWPTAEKLGRVAAVLGTTVDELLGSRRRRKVAR